MRTVRRVWFVAVMAALIAAVPVAIFANSLPWLIAVPIIAGAVLAAVWGLWPEAASKGPLGGHK